MQQIYPSTLKTMAINFRALLNFRVDAGDTVLGEHLKAAAKNVTYTSPVIQNQIIDVLEE